MFNKIISRSIGIISKQRVSLVEVGPRDGLQYEKVILPTVDKVELINRLSNCGFSHIEFGSFVDPKRMPQLSDSDEVFVSLNRHSNIRYTALVPNLKGLNRALNFKIKDIAIFGAASEVFSQKNINCSIEESFQRFKEVIKITKENRINVRGYISCVIGCPYSGKTDPNYVAELTAKMIDLGCYEVSLGDTIGVGTPESFTILLEKVIKHCNHDKLALHCHDTNGKALDNIRRGIEMGIRTIDSSIAGLGGCPYAGPDASGNVATEKVVKLLQKLDLLEESIKVDQVLQTAYWIEGMLKKLH